MANDKQERAISHETYLKTLSSDALAIFKKAVGQSCSTCFHGYFPDYKLVTFFPIGERDWDEEGWYHGDDRCRSQMWPKPKRGIDKLERQHHFQRSI